MSVLFIDVVDSSTLSRSLDPESFQQLVSALLQSCAHHVVENGGFVARFTGDGLLAYFGYPHTHEDDAARAVEAACKMLGAAKDGSGTRLSVRVGVATGRLIVGAPLVGGASTEVPVFGAVVNLAARLQSAAAPDCVFVDEETTNRASGAFRFRPTSPLDLKGFPDVAHAWEVVGSTRREFRSWRHLAEREPQLIQREREIEAAHEAMRMDGAGAAKVLALLGEAGIGKTRVLQEICRYAVASQWRVITASADPLSEHEPLFLADQFKTALGCADADKGIDAADFADLLCQHLGPSPTLLCVEDHHWADPASRRLLEALAERIQGREALLVVTSRERFPLCQRTSARVIEISPLDRSGIADLVRSVADAEIDECCIDLIAARAQGNPLFALELARLLQARPDALADDVPASLSGLLLARLSSLDDALRVAQYAAVFGTSFPPDLLLAMAGTHRTETGARLADLVEAGVFVWDEERDRLSFRHALLRDAAYQTLTRTHARALHLDAATILEQHRAAPIVLANHWLKAGETTRALEAFEDAVDAARARLAHREVEAAATRALPLLACQPNSADRDRREIELRTRLLEAVQINHGYSSPEALAISGDLRRLSARIGEQDKHLLGLAADWMAASSGGDYTRARLLASQAMALAQMHGSTDATAAALMMALTSTYRMGDLVEADALFERGLPLFRQHQFKARPGAVPQAFGNGAIISILRGRLIDARQRAASLLLLSRSVRRPYDAAFAAYMAAMVELLLGADQKAKLLGQLSLRMADQLGFPQFTATAKVVLGRAMAGTGQTDEGRRLLQDGLSGMAAAHSRVAQTLYLTWLAEAHFMASDPVSARDALEAALQVNVDETFYRAETLRLHAIALLNAGDREAGEAALSEAAQLADHQRANWIRDRIRLVEPRLRLGSAAPH